jgi:hypothetical protein
MTPIRGSPRECDSLGRKRHKAIAYIGDIRPMPEKHKPGLPRLDTRRNAAVKPSVRRQSQSPLQWNASRLCTEPRRRQTSAGAAAIGPVGGSVIRQSTDQRPSGRTSLTRIVQLYR